MAPPSASLVLDEAWLAALRSLVGNPQAMAVAAGILVRGDQDARLGRATVYSERALAAEFGVGRRVLRSTISGLVTDGVIEVERGENRHSPSTLGLVGVELVQVQRTPIRIRVVRDDSPDEDPGSEPSRGPSSEPSHPPAITRSHSSNRPAMRGREPSSEPTRGPVPATSQNQGSVRSPKPNGHGRLPTTPLTRGVESVPSASGSAPSVAPLQKSLPLTSQSAATNEPGPSEAKDEAPQGPEEAWSPSGDPSPARVRLSRQPARAIKAADHLRARILAQQPGHQLRTRRWNDDDSLRATWADDVRKLVEIDRRSYEEIAKVIGWLFDRQTAECRFVVHSPGALRAKWDRIVAVMDQPARAPQGGPRGRRSDAEEEAAALAMAPRAPTTWAAPPTVPTGPGEPHRE